MTYCCLICTPESFRPSNCSHVRWLDWENDYPLARAYWPQDPPLSREDWEQNHADGFRYCAIVENEAIADLPAPAGAEVGGRICSTAVAGFAAVQETFTFYDEPSMRFAYQAAEGRPWFLKHAENHWRVRSLGPHTSLVETRAELDVRLFPGWFLAPLLRLKMGRVGVRSLEELKYSVEHDQPHPRKLKALQKQVQKASARS